MPTEIDIIARVADSRLNLADAKLDSEFFYQSLPLCVIDAVFSIGVKYSGVKKVVERYCDTFGLEQFRNPQIEVPLPSKQESITTFCARAEKYGSERMAKEVFCNLQRTSTRAGILKAQAVVEFATVLKTCGVDYFQDIARTNRTAEISDAVLRIKGQSSGISLKYFWMLAGDDQFIKPDRMVLRFLESSLGRRAVGSEAEIILRGATRLLKEKYDFLTPRLLDNVIWNYQRSQ